MRDSAQGDARISDRTLCRLVWVMSALISVLLVAALGLSLLNWSATHTATDWGLTTGAFTSGLMAIGMFSFAVVGALIGSRHPRNAIGWLLLGIGFVWQVLTVTGGYETYGLVTNPGAVPRPDLSVALSQALWIPGLGLVGTFLVLLFPNGHLASTRWRPLAWLSAAAMVLGTIGTTFAPATFEEAGYPGLRNPLLIEDLRGFFDVLSGAAVLLPLCMAASAVSLILRYRRSRGQERLQLKWFAAAVAGTALLFLVAMGASLPLWIAGETTLPVWIRLLQEVSVYSFVLIPIAVGIAILKYRLFAIDLIINRTLVYATLTAVLALIYLGVVTLLGQALRPVTGSTDIAVAGSTLIVAGLFRPVRQRVQGLIDRRFFRQKYDAAQTLGAFSTRLRDEIDLNMLSRELRAVVQETMQPTHVSLWVRPEA